MTTLRPRWTRRLGPALLLSIALALVCSVAGNAYTPGDPEYRAFWVDAWHSGVLRQSEVNKLLGVVGDPNSRGDIRDANCNAVFVQVRRNCDTLYPSGMGEPFMSLISPSDFNGLQAVIDAAHDTTGGKKRIEVHAWIVTFRTSGGEVYYNHNDPDDPANNWVSFDDAGGEVDDKAFDPGHPGCEQYTVDVVMDIVNNFDVDGIHFDYIRFTASNQGYNPTSIARYNERYGLTGQPAPDDEQFMQWRRDQVTAVVRKTYSEVQASKPSVKVSGAFVTWNPSPTSSTRESFEETRPYYDVYSDWDSWMQEGIVDMAVPMTYYNKASLPSDYLRWMNYEKDRHGNRQIIIGPGVYMNSLSNAIAELKATRDPSPSGNYADGFCGYSYFAPFTYGGDNYGPWDIFSPQLLSQVTSTPADIPAMPWKVAPTKGHISGTVTHIPGDTWADGATIHISGPEDRTMLTDGTGFYAFIDLTPGDYTVTASMEGCVSQQRQVNVGLGQVTGNMYIADFALITAPFIFNVGPIDIGTDSATIGWNTDQASSSQVQYGPTTSYGSITPLDPSAVTSHSVVLSGLAADTLYHYCVVSASANGSRTSRDYTFVTGSHLLTLVPNPGVAGKCFGGGWFPQGTPVTLSADMKVGYSFASWSTDPDGVDVVSNANPFVFSMPNSSQTLYANFVPGVPDIIIESRTHGQNHGWYSDSSFGDSTAKSSAEGLTGIGSRYSLIGSSYLGREAHYSPAIPISGWYEVLVTWASSTSGGTKIKHTVTSRDGDYTKTYNQGSSANLQNQWNSIGAFAYLSGESGVCGGLVQWVSQTEADKRILADAAKWVYLGPFKVTTPSPVSGATDVMPINPTLSWVAGGPTDSYDVYLGTSAESMALVSSAQTSASFSPDIIGSTRYYWRVDSNCMDKTTVGDTWTFTTAAIPPIISNIQAINVTDTGATITWTTDQPSTSQVHYGITSGYGQSTTKDANLVTSHSAALTGLTPNTVIHFEAESTSALGLTGTSGEGTFATQPQSLTFVVDNPQGTPFGTWTPLTDTGGWPVGASQYVYATNMRASTTGTFTWTPNIPVAGRYNVYCWYKSGSDRTTSARYTVAYPGWMMVTPVNQALTGSQWVSIATNVQFPVGTDGYVQLTNKTGEVDATKKVIADAMKFEFAETDSTPPTAPSGLTVAAVSGSQNNLAWSPSTDAFLVTGYRVYRDSRLVALTTSTNYADIGLTSNCQYTYTVSAYDQSGNESAQSDSVSRYTFSSPLTVADVWCDRQVGQYYSTPPFTFGNSGFGVGRVSSYRYVWDNSATHAWAETESTWASTSQVLSATSVLPWYLHVKGYNGEGVNNGSMDMGPYYCGQVFDRIANAMNNPDGTVLMIQSYKPITAALPDCFYIEEPDRTRGLRVDGATALPIGANVKVAGKLATVNGERRLIEATVMDSTAGVAPKPIYHRIMALGGKAPDGYTPGAPGSWGLYTCGMLVRVAGSVISRATGSFVLDDGSGATVTVYSDQTVFNGDVVAVTGICALENGMRVIRTRMTADVMDYSDTEMPPPPPM